MGKLFQRIELDDAVNGTDWILENLPADEYNYAHATRAGEVLRLIDHGKSVTFSLNMIGVRDGFAPGGWEHYWSSRIWEDLDEHDCWLYCHAGQKVRFRHFGQPLMVNWAKVGRVPGLLDKWHGYLLEWHGFVPYWLDLCYPQIDRWMFFDENLLPQDLVDYSPVAYGSAVRTFAGKLLKVGRLRFVNGSTDKWLGVFPVMFENMDRTEYRASMWRWVAESMRAATLPGGDVLSLEGGPNEATISITDFWSRSALMCEFKDDRMRELAIKMNRSIR